MATGRSIVDKAIKQLQQAYPSDEATNFNDTSLKDIWGEVRRIEADQGQRGELQNLRRIVSFLEIIDQYTGVLDTFCQGCPFMAFVWVCFLFGYAQYHMLTSIS